MTKHQLEKRLFFMTGWARWWASHSIDLYIRQEQLVKDRGDRFGIAIDSDYHALKYQILEFEFNRASYALGLSGVSFVKSGPKIWSKEEIDSYNKEQLKTYRDRAHKAINRLKQYNLFPCTECHDEGYIIYGDTHYPCSRCQVKGKVSLESMTESDLPEHTNQGGNN